MFSAKYKDGLHWIICADKNDLKLDSILALNQNFKQCVKSPTRLSPPAILDIIVTDLCSYYQDPVCEKPLDVDSDKIGSPSDHLMVVMEPINAFNNRKERKERSFLYRSFSIEAFHNMDKELDNDNWSEILNDNSSQD